MPKYPEPFILSPKQKISRLRLSADKGRLEMIIAPTFESFTP